MPVSSSILAELLPRDSGELEPVSRGESGAYVGYDRGQQRYVKIVSSERVAELTAERDRGIWLNQTDIPSARVLDWRETDVGARLVTQAVSGMPASELDAPSLLRAWPSVIDAVRALHELATDRCPFDRALAQLMPLARATVAADRVVTEFLPEPLQSTPPTQILERLETELPVRVAQERAHLVVCHGDLCLPNIVVDPATGHVRAVIDLGRLGTADPYLDIALLLGTARHTWTDEAMSRRAVEEFTEVYGADLDPGRQDFYRRLDPLTW